MGYIHRSGHIVHNGIQQLLDTLVAVRSTAGNGNDAVIDGTLAQAGLDLLNGELLAVQVLHHNFLVLLSSSLDQLLMIFLSLLLQIIRNLDYRNILAQIIIVDIGLHLNQIHQTLEELFSTDGQLNGNRVAVQTGLHHVNYMIEVCTHDIHLINISHSGDHILVGLTPYSFGLRLNTALGAENCYRAVQHSQGALYFYCKVNVSGGINNVDTMALPVCCGGSRGNGDTSLLLLNHPVHGGAAIVNLTQLMVNTCIEQDTLGCGGLTSIDMGHDANVSGHFQ